MRSKHLGRVASLALILLGLCVPAVRSQALPGAESGPVLIQGLSFTKTASQTVVLVSGDRAFDYTSYYPNPRLFILDLPGARSALEKNFVDFKTGQIDFATVST